MVLLYSMISEHKNTGKEDPNSIKSTNATSLENAINLNFFTQQTQKY